MRKAPQRRECPACLGVALEIATVSNGAKVHHCRRCGGSWLLRGQIPRLRAVSARALQIMVRRGDEAGFVCHGCHAPMERDEASCAACGWANRVDCPECGKPMRRQTERGVTMDVCRGCQGVWLDHHELSAVWVGAATVAMAQASGGSNLALTPEPWDLLEIFVHAPELAVHAVRGAAHVTEAGIDAVSRAPDLLASAPDALGAFFEVMADIAGAVFGLIADIIGGLFDGLG